MFLVHSRENDVEERLKEFLALASSSLLRLGHENEKEAIRTRESVYLLLHIIVKESNVSVSVSVSVSFIKSPIQLVYTGIRYIASSVNRAYQRHSHNAIFSLEFPEILNQNPI